MSLEPRSYLSYQLLIGRVHGIVLVGAMIALGHAQTPFEITIGFIGVLLGAGNAAGGYVVTERMLEMFKPSKPDAGKGAH